MTGLQFQQTGGAGLSAGAYCSPSGTAAGVQAMSRHCAVGGTPGESSGHTRTTNDQTAERALYLSFTPGQENWAGGTYTVRLRNSTTSNFVTISRVDICRLNSAGVSQDTIGSESGLSIALTSAGVKTIEVEGSAQSLAADDDRVIVIVSFASSGTGSWVVVNWVPDQIIDTPIGGDSGITEEFGRATETESGRSFASGKVYDAGRATETEGARDLSASFDEGDIFEGFGRATETEAARAWVASKAAAFGRAAETEIARALSHSKSATLGRVLESEIARAFAAPISKLFGRTVEEETARDFEATIVVQTYSFTPPSTSRRDPRFEKVPRFFRFTNYEQGLSVVTTGATFRTVERVIPQPDWVEGVDYFVGGHVYSSITREVAQSLIAAGYAPTPNP